jgi:hypothetical protein
MFPIEIFQASLAKLTSILQEHNIRYHLTGGLTGTAYGEPGHNVRGHGTGGTETATFCSQIPNSIYPDQMQAAHEDLVPCPRKSSLLLLQLSALLASVAITRAVLSLT